MLQGAGVRVPLSFGEPMVCSPCTGMQRSSRRLQFATTSRTAMDAQLSSNHESHRCARRYSTSSYTRALSGGAFASVSGPLAPQKPRRPRACSGADGSPRGVPKRPPVIRMVVTGSLDFDLSTAKLSDALRTHRPASPAPAGAPGAPRIPPSGEGTRHAAGAACAGDPSPLTQA